MNGSKSPVELSPVRSDSIEEEPHELLIPFTEGQNEQTDEPYESPDNKSLRTNVDAVEKTEDIILNADVEDEEPSAVLLVKDAFSNIIDDISSKSVIEVDPSAPVKARTWKMCAALAAVLIATISVIVYGVFLKDAVKDAVNKVDSLPSMLIGEVFSRGVTRYNGGKTVSLRRIPLPRIIDEENPGAAEEEFVPNADAEEPGAKGDYLRIKEVDLSVGESGIFTIINETGYEPELTRLLTSPFPVPNADSIIAEYGSEAPLVIILHTHGSESFSPEGKNEVSSDSSFRSDDPSKSVVSVGRAFAETLRSHGIGVVHIETMFDLEDYNSAYVKSAAAINECLEKYPSVQYVFDIHRDALITEGGENLKPTAEGGEAQTMIVVGTDYGGAEHPRWEDNLVVALRLQEAAGTETPSLVRGINLRSPSFNEQYAPGSLLLEIGAAGNTLGEAEAAARLMGEAASKVILSGGA